MTRIPVIPLSLLACTLMVLAAPAAAQPDARDAPRESWAAMSPEERAELREAMQARRAEVRERWAAMTPEEREEVREAMRVRREEARARWDALEPEEREALRQQMRERRADRPWGPRREGEPPARSEPRSPRGSGR